MTATLEIHPDVEILPGYRLIRKIGSGGYGEVWLCDAPGGLKKAIKIVYGTLDEDRASSELRSLQRIREVKHPFILSLERIEVVDGHLLIVTELAESSLFDQFQAYCYQGMNGIPRDRLIGYLRDTAEALDFLSLKHDLQHLDVKPGNLLLVADRVKLADFGVVKNLSEKQHSCIGGLTPTYAAPEMFDGRAGRHSDQYSLAIMYYELLTGRPPFDGSTLAHLATQHLQHKPNIDLVPEAEQLILYRALAKDPAHRFPSCSEFIERLATADQEYTSRPSPPKGDGMGLGPRAFAPKRRSIARGDYHVARKESTVLVAQKPITNLPALADSIAGTWRQSPSLFIGLGGVGCEVLAQLRTLFLESEAPTEHTHWLLIDTCMEGLKAGADKPEIAFENQEKLFIPLRDAHYYRDTDSDKFATISRRWLYNIPRNQTTGGARPLGQVALLDHQTSIARGLGETLQELVEYKNTPHLEEGEVEEDTSSTLRVYLVTSAHGGTGSAMFCDIGFAIRSLLDEMEIPDYQIIGLVSAAAASADPKEMIPSAASIAFFQELSHYFNVENEYYGLTEKPFYASPESTAERKPPVDQVYCFTNERLSAKEGLHHSIYQMAQLMILDSSTNIGRVLDKARTCAQDQPLDASNSWLRAINFHPCSIESRNRLSDIVQSCIAEYCKKWFPFGASSDGLGKTSVRPDRDSIHTTGLLSDNKEYVTELSHNLDQLLSDLRFSGEAWLHNCSKAVRALYPKSRNPFQEPIQPIIETFYQKMMEGCSVRSRLSSIPCKINLGLLTGLHLQAKNIEESLQRSKLRNEQDLDALKLLGKENEASKSLNQSKEQEVTQLQLIDVSRKLQLAILRYDSSLRILHGLVQKLEEHLQNLRRRMAKLHRSWSSWPSLLPDQGNVSFLKSLESDALGMKLLPFVDEIRRYIHSALRSVSTYVVQGESEVTKISGAMEGASFVQLLRHDPELAFDFSKVLFAMENLLKKDHPDLTDGQVEQMWFQHQVGWAIRESLEKNVSKQGEYGGMRRLFLAAPVSQSNVLSNGSWREQMELPLSIVSAPVEEKLIGAELEQLDLAAICTRMWGNAPELMALVERMYSRTDTQWAPLQPPASNHDQPPAS